MKIIASLQGFHLYWLSMWTYTPQGNMKSFQHMVSTCYTMSPEYFINTIRIIQLTKWNLVTCQCNYNTMKLESPSEVSMKVIKATYFKLLSVPLNVEGEEMRRKQCSCVLIGIYISGFFIKLLPKVSLHLEHFWVRTLVFHFSL